MSTRSLPRIEYAVFCEHAERDGLGFISMTRLKHTIPRVPGTTAGIAMWLVFGIEAAPMSVVQLNLALVWPSGKRQSQSYSFDMNNTGFFEVNANLTPLLVNELGEMSVEFRFGEALEPDHVATLVVVDAPYQILPKQALDSSQKH